VHMRRQFHRARPPIPVNGLTAYRLARPAAAACAAELARGVQHVVRLATTISFVEMNKLTPLLFDAPGRTTPVANWVIEAGQERSIRASPIRYVPSHPSPHGPSRWRARPARRARRWSSARAPGSISARCSPRRSRATRTATRPISAAPDRRGRRQVRDSDGPSQWQPTASTTRIRSRTCSYVPDAKLGYVTDLWSPGRDPLPPKITPPLASVVAGVRGHGHRAGRAGGHGSTGDFATLQNWRANDSLGRDSGGRLLESMQPPR